MMIPSNIRICLFFILLLFFAICKSQSRATTHFSLFDTTTTGVTLFHKNFPNIVYVGPSNGELEIKVNLGFDFPFVSLYTEQSKHYSIGAFAFTNMYLYKENSIYHVDNFYAGFGAYLQGVERRDLSWRFYPYYHTSAHLSDGYIRNGIDTVTVSNKTGFILKDKKTISNEMLYWQLCYKPAEGIELGGAAGYYYHHTDAQKNLKGRVEGDFIYIFPGKVYNISPYVYLFSQCVLAGTRLFGFEYSVGGLVRNHKDRGFTFGFKYFYVPHPGQYWGLWESGYGVEFRFLQ